MEVAKLSFSCTNTRRWAQIHTLKQVALHISALAKVRALCNHANTGDLTCRTAEGVFNS